MKRAGLALCLGIITGNSFLPALAQGDPVPGAPVNTPKVEVIEVPQNNGLINALQNFQFQQNQTNSIINSTAVKVNPAITPLDQRIQNSNKFNIFGVNGLGISSGNNPFIVNSHLMAGGDLMAKSKDFAAFLMRADINANKNDLLRGFSTLPSPVLIGGLMMALNLPQDLFNSIMNKAVQGGLEGLRSSLIDLAIALKTGKISPADAQRVLMQMLGLMPATKVAASVTPIKTTQTSTQTTTQPQIVKLSVTPVSTIQTNVVNNNATPIATTTTNTVVSNIGTTTPETNVSQVPTKVTEIQKQPAKVPGQITIVSAQPTNTPATNTANNQPIYQSINQSTLSSSDLSNALNKIVSSNQEKTNELTNKLDSFYKGLSTSNNGGSSSGSSGNIVNPNPTKINVNTAPLEAAVGSVVSTLGNALGLISSASTKAASTKSQGPVLPPGMPDPSALGQSTVVTVLLAELKMPPILSQTIMTKTMLGHFNGGASSLRTLTSMLSIPSLTKSEAQAIVLAFLDATKQPIDIPVDTIKLVINQSSGGTSTATSTSKQPTTNDLLLKMNGIQNVAVTMQTTMKNAPPSQAQAEAKVMAAMVSMLTNMVDGLQTDLTKMTNASMNTVNSIFNAAQESSNTMNQLFQTQSH